ncbi:MAG TPA: PIG-L family deacetylase [Terriglobales bacterium]|nr:PIG-L family deacetylase [Terriglobales bacterium]
MRRLLCITAHPDDEAGGFGGSLLKYRSEGVETFVVCLTPGQAATHRGGARSDAELAAMRRQEFARSCEILQISQGEVLDFADAALDRASFYQVVCELALRIRRIRPQVILTLGTEGAITAHPDHSMAALFATAAFHWAGRSNRYPEQLGDKMTPHRANKLYYSTANFVLPERQPVSLAPATAHIEVAPWFEQKIAAFKAHTSQKPLFDLFETNVRKRGTVELFHLAACSEPGEIRRETDLFEGIE